MATEKKGKHLAKNIFCDPTPKAYRLADIKMRIRAMNKVDPKNLYWLREYNRHTKAVEDAKPIVDTKPPIVKKCFYDKSTSLNHALKYQTRIESENATLLRQLAAIYNGEIKGMDMKPHVPRKLIENRTQERSMREMDIMNENFKKYLALQNVKPVYSRQKLSEWYVQHQILLDRVARYPPFQAAKLCPIPFRKIMEKSIGQPKQYAYLLLEAEHIQAENLIIELYADLCPFTVKNFQRLCTNTKATACDCRTYRCKKIEELHSVQVMNGSFMKLYWVVGEHVDSAVEYSQMITKESSPISHSEAGLITRPKSRAGGTFFITIGPCPHLDEFCYVFGKINQKGIDFLKKMEDKNTEINGSTIVSIHITDCGLLSDPDDAPPPMLLHDFISQARLDIMPFIQRKPDKPEDWLATKSKFADYLKERANEGKEKFNQTAVEGRSLADMGDGDGDDEAD